MQLDISSQEQELLVHVLDNYLRDLRSEIYHTDSSGFKDELKEREETINELLTRLRSPTRASAG